MCVLFFHPVPSVTCLFVCVCVWICVFVLDKKQAGVVQLRKSESMRDAFAVGSNGLDAGVLMRLHRM